MGYSAFFKNDLNTFLESALAYIVCVGVIVLGMSSFENITYKVCRSWLNELEG